MKKVTLLTLWRFNFKIGLILTFMTGIFFASCSKIDPAPVISPANKTGLKAANAASQTNNEA